MSCAVLFQFGYPDVGCSDEYTATDCERMSSPYEASQPACKWYEGDEPQCQLFSPDPNNACVIMCCCLTLKAVHNGCLLYLLTYRYSAERMLKVVVALAATKPFVILAEHLLFFYCAAPSSSSSAPADVSSPVPTPAAPPFPRPKIVLPKISSTRMSPRRRRRGGGGIPLRLLCSRVDLSAPVFSEDFKTQHSADPTTIDDITDVASFEIFCDTAAVQEADAVFRRHAELDEAIEFLTTRVNLPTATVDDHRRLETVKSIAHIFITSWSLRYDEATTRHLVRQKVRRDVKRALEWDSELSQLSNARAREKKLVEVRETHINSL